MQHNIEDEFTNGFGDKRLLSRCQNLTLRLWDQLNESVTHACQGWAEVVAAFRFFNNEKVNLMTILLGHKQATLSRVKQETEVLAIQDTSEVSYGQRKISGIGPTSTTRSLGFYWHMTLLVSRDRLQLGIWCVETIVRTALKRKNDDSHKKVPIEEKESGRWLRGYKEACELQKLAPETTIISIGDRESDIYEIYTEASEAAKKETNPAHWLIRSAQNRRVLLDNCDANHRSLQLAVMLAPVAAEGTINVQATPKRPARTAHVKIKIVPVTICPPVRKEKKMPFVSATAIVVSEYDTSDGVTPLQWTLLTSLSVNSVTDACDVVDRYAARWEIEVWFRTWKTGCKIESLQLKTCDRLEPCLGLYAILTWRLLYLSRLSRVCLDAPASLVFSDDELKAISLLALNPRKGPPLIKTIAQAVLAIAIIGGFLNRKSDGNPGVETFWKGFAKINIAVAVLENTRYHEAHNNEHQS
jgi:hypothetical protein